MFGRAFEDQDEQSIDRASPSIELTEALLDGTIQRFISLANS